MSPNLALKRLGNIAATVLTRSLVCSQPVITCNKAAVFHLFKPLLTFKLPIIEEENSISSLLRVWKLLEMVSNLELLRL